MKILETFTCGGQSPGTGTLSLVSEDTEALKKPTAYLGYQFVRKVECADEWTHKVEKQVKFDTITSNILQRLSFSCR